MTFATLFALIILILILLDLLLYWLSLRPSNQRDWVTYQSVMPTVKFDGDRVKIKGVRNFRYNKDESFKEAYEDRSYDLNKLDSVWFVVVPFGKWRGIAHTFLSFGFEDGKYVSISAEIRREKGEEFSPVLGMLKHFEFIYVVADEEDIIKLRSNIRERDVYLYPVRTNKARMRKLFVNILKDANSLLDRPRFYSTLNNSCSTVIARHINQIVPGRVPFNWRIWAPGYSDRLGYNLGLIDTDLSFGEAQKHFMISNAARSVKKGEDFSAVIRRDL